MEYDICSGEARLFFKWRGSRREVCCYKREEAWDEGFSERFVVVACKEEEAGEGGFRGKKEKTKEVGNSGEGEQNMPQLFFIIFF